MSKSSQKISNEYQLYCMNVGHLVNSFNRLENLLTTILKTHLLVNIAGSQLDVKTKENIRALRLSSAIYGGMRYSNSRDTLKRLMKAEETKEATVCFMTDAFAHIGEIESFRNKLVHQMVTPAHADLEKYWQVSDTLTTRSIQSPQFWVFDTISVNHAADDLLDFQKRIGDANPSETLLNGIDDTSPMTWRYKPSMLELVPHDKLKKPPKL